MFHIPGKPVTNTMTRITSESGKQVAIRISTALLLDDADIIVGGVETFQDLSQVEQLQKQLERRYTYEDIIGRSPSMRSLFRILPKVAQSTSTVLIGGTSGTGKELFARAIHNLSPRKNRRFVAINCAALPDTLLESELFGYKAGAFTGAAKDKPGRFALAQGGTLFLDEIGDISPAMQARLLRVLQERTIEPLGGLEPLKVDVRIIAATNKDLARLMDYDYPGNVRELENILEHAFVLCRGGVIELCHLPPELRPDDVLEVDGSRKALTLKALEKIYISGALRRHAGNRTAIAKAGMPTNYWACGPYIRRPRNFC